MAVRLWRRNGSSETTSGGSGGRVATTATQVALGRYGSGPFRVEAGNAGGKKRA